MFSVFGSYIVKFRNFFWAENSIFVDLYVIEFPIMFLKYAENSTDDLLVDVPVSENSNDEFSF